MKYKFLIRGKNVNSVAGDAATTSANIINLTTGAENVYDMAWAASPFSIAANNYVLGFKDGQRLEKIAEN
jgi:steroid 5-alpha reductase family enzyme